MDISHNYCSSVDLYEEEGRIYLPVFLVFNTKQSLNSALVGDLSFVCPLQKVKTSKGGGVVSWLREAIRAWG